MAVGYKSAINGSITWNGGAVTNVSNIQFTRDALVQKHQTSSTAGVVKRISGGTDKSGSFTVLEDDVGFDEGDTGQLVIKSDSGTTIFDELVFIESISPAVPIDGGGNVSCVVNFGRTVA